MRERTHRVFWALILTLAFGLVSVRTLDAGENKPVWRTGISYERLSRTITWDGGAGQSKLKADLITAREAIELKPGLAFELIAGLSLSNFNGLAFTNLPISLDYEAGAAKGLLLGAGIRARLLTFGNFEIEGVGRFVYSLGLKTTWPLEGFAVPGNTTGSPTWLEGSAGARLSYRSSGRFVPYAAVQASFFSGSFAMDETLGDLTGHETKKLKSKNLLEVTLGAEILVAERLTLRAEAGILPYAGAVDGVAWAGFLYRF
jgi:hypothetical protein